MKRGPVYVDVSHDLRNIDVSQRRYVGITCHGHSHWVCIRTWHESWSRNHPSHACFDGVFLTRTQHDGAQNLACVQRADWLKSAGVPAETWKMSGATMFCTQKCKCWRLGMRAVRRPQKSVAGFQPRWSPKPSGEKHKSPKALAPTVG